jgi:hypothetical protein
MPRLAATPTIADAWSSSGGLLVRRYWLVRRRLTDELIEWYD